MRLETGRARELEASRCQAKKMHYPEGRQPSWSFKHESDMFRFVLYKDHWQWTKHTEEQSWKPAEQLEGCCTDPGQEIIVALTKRKKGGHPTGVQLTYMCALCEWGMEGGWRLQRRARTWEVSALGNSVVPFTETNNWREVPDGRKVASSLLPEPLTCYFS